MRILSLLLAGAVILDACALEFDWATPLPHRQEWKALAAGNGVAVGITDGWGGRHIYSSQDGKTWNRAVTPPIERLWNVTFANGNFIAVGWQQSILTSANGTDWTLRTSNPFGSTLFDAASGNGVTVAVGYNASMLVSTDLKNWKQLNSFGNGYNLNAVEYGNGRFVAIGDTRLWTSVDGFSWTESTWPSAAGSASCLAFNNGKFAMSAGRIYTSTDGANWRAASEAQFGNIVATTDGFLGIEPTLSKSADGVSWEILLDYPGDPMTCFTSGAQLNGRLIAAGTQGLLFTSDNGTDWDKVVEEEINYSHSQIAFGNGEFLRFGETKPGVEISRDGVAWTAFDDTPAFKFAVFGNSRWAAVSGDGELYSSADGREWQSAGAMTLAHAVRFANGLFVAESQSEPGLLISSDGRAWKRVVIPGAQFVRVLGNVNGRWAARVDYQTPATSDDGENWIVHPAQSGMQGYLGAAGNGRFLLVGGAGMGPGYASWSADGIHWESQPQTGGTTYLEQSLTYANGNFVLTDLTGGVFVSQNGTDWTGDRQAFQTFSGAAFGNGFWLIAGGDSILKSTTVQLASVGTTLELTQRDFSNWTIILKGLAGTVCRVESTSGLSQPWTTLQTVEIPAHGRFELNINPSSPTAFFRAVATAR